MTSPRLRAMLDVLPRYAAGRAPARSQGLTPYKMSSNENPYPPLPGVLDAIVAAASDANRYPDPSSRDLTAALAEQLEVPPTHLALGTGSVALLAHLVQASCDAGDEVVHAWRSFEAYPIVSLVAGAESVPVALRADSTHDLPSMLAAVTPRTRLVLVCTPNNPTGPAVAQRDLTAFLAELPRDVLVVVDEAYVEFIRDPAAADGVATYREHPNVAVLRTFSKAYGLAGLRVGYVVAHDPVAAAVRRVATPFGVSRVAQAAAVASLAAREALFARVEQVVVERTRLRDALLAQGHRVPVSEANFVWLPLGERAVEFATVCAEADLAVRAFDGAGVRVTVAEPDANTRLLTLTPPFVPS